MSTLTDLGECGALSSAGVPCSGRLIFERDLGVLREAVCDSCGAHAARPSGKPAPERPSSSESWYEKW